MATLKKKNKDLNTTIGNSYYVTKKDFRKPIIEGRQKIDILS